VHSSLEVASDVDRKAGDLLSKDCEVDTSKPAEAEPALMEHHAGNRAPNREHDVCQRWVVMVETEMDGRRDSHRTQPKVPTKVPTFPWGLLAIPALVSVSSAELTSFLNQSPPRSPSTSTPSTLRSSRLFESMYSTTGRPSIPPERLLKSMLLIALYSVRSEPEI